MQNPLHNFFAACIAALVLVLLVALAQSAEAQEGKTKIEFLLGTELNPFWTDENSWTQLHWAAAADDGKAASRLLELGAASNITDNGGRSDFSGQGKKRLKLLGKEWKEADGWKNTGNTPLHVAAAFNSHVVASILIANGAAVNAKAEDGDTPLHRAAWENAAEIAKLLIASGAAINTKNSLDDTPIDYAIGKGHGEMRSLLARAGGASGQSLPGASADKAWYSREDIKRFETYHPEGKDGCDAYLIRQGLVPKGNSDFYDPVGVGSIMHVSGEKARVIKSGGTNTWFKRIHNKLYQAEGVSLKKRGGDIVERTILVRSNKKGAPKAVYVNDNKDQMLTEALFGISRGACYIREVSISKFPVRFVRASDMVNPTDIYGGSYSPQESKTITMNADECYDLWIAQKGLRIPSDTYNKLKECYDAGLLGENIAIIADIKGHSQ